MTCSGPGKSFINSPPGAVHSGYCGWPTVAPPRGPARGYPRGELAALSTRCIVGTQDHTSIWRGVAGAPCGGGAVPAGWTPWGELRRLLLRGWSVQGGPAGVAVHRGLTWWGVFSRKKTKNMTCFGVPMTFIELSLTCSKPRHNAEPKMSADKK